MPNTAYAAEDVAKAIINYSIDNEFPISNLKLQKILYYVQAAFLTEKNRPAFNEDIVSWRYGPVVEEVYRKYKYNSDRPILEKEDMDESIFSKNDLEIIQKVTECKNKYSVFELVRLTHNEDPWKNTPINSTIHKKLIKSYFSESESRRKRIW